MDNPPTDPKPKDPPKGPPAPPRPPVTRPAIPAPAKPPPPAPTMTYQQAAHLLYAISSPNEYDAAEKTIIEAFHGAPPWNLITKHIVRKMNAW